MLVVGVYKSEERDSYYVYFYGVNNKLWGDRK